MKPFGIHWFRRDLRVAGNSALKFNFKTHEGRVVGLFCFDSEFLSRGDFSVNRFQIFLETLRELKEELRAMGSDLLFLDKGPSEAFPGLFDKMAAFGEHPHLMTWSRDYEPFARKRDKAMTEYLKSVGVPLKTFRDHLVIEPHELTKDDKSGDGYQVYSPFARKWLKLFMTSEMQKRITSQKKGLSYLKGALNETPPKIFNLSWDQLIPKDSYPDNLAQYISENRKKVTVPLPSMGRAAVFQAIQSFRPGLSTYGDQRDFPYLNGTSRFSMFLKNGSLTVPQVIAAFDLKAYEKKNTGESVFFSELIWREFYYHILFRHPGVESQSFLKKFQNLPWQNSTEYFEAWKAGRTGFPIVDAGMRELATTGWMHNRVRMIVASFLTKDLLVDWRWGEKYFMDQLLDGDLAPNNGGWQWAASTGCDPQPFFRIFNPWSQSLKFDKEGTYIKTFLPELSTLPAKALHEPIRNHPSYPEPIVEHAAQRLKALAMYKAAHEQSKI